MPSYEMIVITRNLPKIELAQYLKRTANFILNNNGILRDIENLGERPLHLKLSNPIPNTSRYTSANFFLYHFDTSPPIVRKIQEDCRRDNETIRAYYVKKEKNLPDGYECTLDDEMKPPAMRPSVRNLIEQGRKKKTPYDMGGETARQIL